MGRLGQNRKWLEKILAFACIGEAATGLLLIIYPPIVVRLLCGLEVSGSGVLLSRIFGISLIAISVACWNRNSPQSFLGLLTYTGFSAVYMTMFGLAGNAGILLWPAVLLHVIVTVLLGRAWLPPRASAFSEKLPEPDG